MENKKMNWGTLILGIVIGAIVVGVIWMATKPATSAGQGANPCVFLNNLVVRSAGQQEGVSNAVQALRDAGVCGDIGQ